MTRLFWPAAVGVVAMAAWSGYLTVREAQLSVATSGFGGALLSLVAWLVVLIALYRKR